MQKKKFQGNTNLKLFAEQEQQRTEHNKVVIKGLKSELVSRSIPVTPENIAQLYRSKGYDATLDEVKKLLKEPTP